MPFNRKVGDAESRLRHIEEYLSRWVPESSNEERTRESISTTQRTAADGSSEGGGGSSHAILSATHYDSDQGDTPATGDVFTYSGSLWQAASPAHNLLSATHSDATTSAVTAGDIVYANSTPAWDDLPIGTSGQVLTVSGGLPAWADASSVSSGRTVLGVWTKQDCSLIGLADELIFTAWTKGANDTLADVMGDAGEITALGFITDGDLGGVGDTLIVTVYKNGSATSATVTLTCTGGTDTKPTPWEGSVTFAQNDELSVYVKRGGPVLNARLLKVFVWGKVNA